MFLVFTRNHSGNINFDTVCPTTVTLCFAYSTATIMSLLHTLNKLGDIVHASANPCKASTFFQYFLAQHHSTSLTFRNICHHSPHLCANPNFYNFSHNSFLHTCHRTSVHPGRHSSTLVAPSPSTFNFTALPNVYTWSTRLRFGLNLAFPSLFFLPSPPWFPFIVQKLTQRFAFDAT